MLVDGQTEMKEVSLPAGYDFGLFRVQRPVSSTNMGTVATVAV